MEVDVEVEIWSYDLKPRVKVELKLGFEVEAAKLTFEMGIWSGGSEVDILK